MHRGERNGLVEKISLALKKKLCQKRTRLHAQTMVSPSKVILSIVTFLAIGRALSLATEELCAEKTFLAKRENVESVAGLLHYLFKYFSPLSSLDVARRNLVSSACLMPCRLHSCSDRLSRKRVGVFDSANHSVSLGLWRSTLFEIDREA